MPNTYTISFARKMVELFARNGGDSTVYPKIMVDFAFRRAANWLVREASLCLRIDGQDTVANQSGYTLSLTDFRPERVNSVFLTGPNVVVRPWSERREYVRGGSMGWVGGNGGDGTAQLEIVDYEEINDLLIAQPGTGQPRMIGFSGDLTYSLWPNPDQVYTVNQRWSDLFTVWNPGIPLTSFNNSAGVLSSVTVIDGSDNQPSGLTASFSDSGSGSGATATPTVTNGVLAGVVVNPSGSGYSSATQLLLGGYNSADQTFNVADDLLDEVMSLGAPAFLQFNDPSAAFATEKGQEFLAFVAKVKGKIGGLGVRKIIRR